MVQVFKMPVKTKKKGNFLYFAYDINLSSLYFDPFCGVRAGVAKLHDYELDFAEGSSGVWEGVIANLTPKRGSHVWGALWKYELEEMEHVDRRQGLHRSSYIPITVEVETPSGEKLQCRTYKQIAETPMLPSIYTLPHHRKPCALYLNGILHGAEESGLPETYQAFLSGIPFASNSSNPYLGMTLGPRPWHYID